MGLKRCDAGSSSARVAPVRAGVVVVSASAMLSAAQQALRAHGQHDHHDDEGQHDRVGRHVDGAELIGETDQHRADARRR